ncbi:RAM1 [Candida jiufengensis]|uniref:RAM1 n=1 Tax=Candida jiufengensis TaxID=497108 RepID=UPI002224447B|nr:RAM1 [Candida jiufengensis]KAI5955280.1 RAM1 [Candida jiufengensis]
MTSKQRNQVDYLINLLGRKRSIIEQEIESSSEEEIYTNLSQKEMLEQLSTLYGWQMSKPHLKASLYESSTTIQQDEVTNDILENYLNITQLDIKSDQHVNYVLKCLNSKLPSYYKSLDANHPWMTYWLINSFYTIKNQSEPQKKFNVLDQEIIDLINAKIETCIIEDGQKGISGGKNQIGHVASTYAGVLTLVLTKNYTLLKKLKSNIYDWLMSLKIRINDDQSAFIMHENGEYDTRSTYCVLVIATLLNIKTSELLEGVEDWILSCQTYEGGFAGIPNTESHGGYNFCAIASLFLINSDPHQVSKKIKNLDTFIKWNCDRITEEGGFNGRSNKLVDACYSFWIGAVFPMISVMVGHNLMNKDSLFNYILRISQNFEKGGFKDKPNKSVDFYHTNYTLMGLSLCEYEYEVDELKTGDDDCLALRFLEKTTENNDDKFTNVINPVFGLPIEFLKEMRAENI